MRDRDHVRYVANNLVWFAAVNPRVPIGQSRELGRKVGDEFTVPLCRGHHREVHRCGDEAAWWQKAGADPTVALERCGQILARQRLFRRCCRPMTRLNSWQLRPLKTNMV
jgi:hypothetical protein